MSAKDIVIFPGEQGLTPYERVLAELDIPFRSASEHQAGITLIRTQPPVLIIVDYSPQSQETCRLIKQYADTKRIPILWVSPRDRLEETAWALTIPVNDYLFSPFTAEELSLRIKTLMAMAAISLKEQLKNVEEKAQELHKLIELFPDYNAARLELAELYAHNGQQRECLQEYFKLMHFYYVDGNLGEARGILEKLHKNLSGHASSLNQPSLAQAMQRLQLILDFWTNIHSKEQFEELVTQCLSMLEAKQARPVAPVAADHQEA